MKGLFNYETAYRKYTRECLHAFVEDNIQYAEIRPNFMQTNQIWKDDGKSQLSNADTINIIIQEYEKFQAELAESGQYFGGLKIIYCTPRSFLQGPVRDSLAECLEFKQRWPQWIAGKCREVPKYHGIQLTRQRIRPRRRRKHGKPPWFLCQRTPRI
jgi:adenosine deaminase CECR1